MVNCACASLRDMEFSHLYGLGHLPSLHRLPNWYWTWILSTNALLLLGCMKQRLPLQQWLHCFEEAIEEQIMRGHLDSALVQELPQNTVLVQYPQKGCKYVMWSVDFNQVLLTVHNSIECHPGKGWRRSYLRSWFQVLVVAIICFIAVHCIWNGSCSPPALYWTLLTPQALSHLFTCE